MNHSICKGTISPSFPQEPTLPVFFLIYMISFCSLTWSVWHLQALKFSTTGLCGLTSSSLPFAYKDHLTLINFFRFISHIFSSWTLQFKNTVSHKTLWFLPFSGLSTYLKSLPCLLIFFFPSEKCFPHFFRVSHLFLAFFFSDHQT